MMLSCSTVCRTISLLLIVQHAVSFAYPHGPKGVGTMRMGGAHGEAYANGGLGAGSGPLSRLPSVFRLPGKQGKTSNIVDMPAANLRGGGASSALISPLKPLRAGSGAVPADQNGAFGHRMKVGLYFMLWYILNIGYNITNKKTLQQCAFPVTLSVVQLLVGSLYALPLWLTGIRKAPIITKESLKSSLPIALCHAISHLSAVVALGAGTVSFAHIVKAAEPFFTATFSAAFLGQVFPLPVYLALLPVVGGVALASLHELSFKWIALAGSMGSNIAAATRGILAKKNMESQASTDSPENLYAMLTIMATFMLIPVAAIWEGPKLDAIWKAAIAGGATRNSILKGTILSGLFFYLYNEVAFLALNAVHPVTHAVGNTFKRVFVIGFSIIVFGNKITPLGGLGSGMAIVGVLVYSLLKDFYAKKEKNKLS